MVGFDPVSLRQESPQGSGERLAELFLDLGQGVGSCWVPQLSGFGEVCFLVRRGVGVQSACRQCITYVDTHSPGADPGPVVIACHDQRVNSVGPASLSASSDLWQPGRGSSASPIIRRSANSERTYVPSP